MDTNEDSYEIDYTTDEDYQKEYAFLMDRIRMREEMKELLKIAKPHHMARIRGALAKFDEVIDQTEQIMEIRLKKLQLEKECEIQDAKVLAMMEKMLPEFRAFLAEHNPEELEKLDAALSDDDKTH